MVSFGFYGSSEIYITQSSRMDLGCQCEVFPVPFIVWPINGAALTSERG